MTPGASNKTSFIDPGRAFFAGAGKPVPYRERTALDFWKWAYSDLLQNITRGIVAEFLVAWAAGVDDVPRQPWDSYDLELSNGTKVEVKCTGLVQAWTYTKRIIPKFIIMPRREWTAAEGMREKTQFNADLYVLCLHKESDRNRADPMHSDQWEFWVLTQGEVRDVLDGRQGITVKQLQQHKTSVPFHQLGELIAQQAGLKL